MVRLLRFAAVVALGGIATAGLSACAGDGAEGEVVSPSVSVVASPPPSVTPSPSVTPEEELLARIPENARIESFPSAVAFVEFFVAESQAILQTRDAELFLAVSGPDCTFCVARVELLRRLEREGGAATPGLITLYPDTVAGGLQPDETWNVSLDADVESQVFYDAAGDVTEEEPFLQLRIGVGLVWTGHHWQVIDVSSEAR